MVYPSGEVETAVVVALALVRNWEFRMVYPSGEVETPVCSALAAACGDVPDGLSIRGS